MGLRQQRRGLESRAGQGAFRAQRGETDGALVCGNSTDGCSAANRVPDIVVEDDGPSAAIKSVVR